MSSTINIALYGRFCQEPTANFSLGYKDNSYGYVAIQDLVLFFTERGFFLTGGWVRGIIGGFAGTADGSSNQRYEQETST
jgi:hypothetical protein